MKKLTTGEIILLSLIVFLVFWIGTSTWHLFKDSVAHAQGSVATHHRDAKQRVTNAAQTSRLMAKSKRAEAAANAQAVRELAADPTSYLDELRRYPSLAGFANNQNVQLFMNYIGKDFSSLFDKSDSANIEPLMEAAALLAPKITDCLSNPKKCGVTDLGSYYRADSEHPLETILASALDCLREAESNGISSNSISTEEVMKALSIGENNVQFEASEILAQRNLSDQELGDVFSQSAEVQGEAKVAFFKLFEPQTARDAFARNTFMAALNQTLSDSNNVSTAKKVFNKLQHLNLSPAEFTEAAANACTINIGYDADESRKLLQENIQNNARRAGYEVDFDTLCAGAAGDGRR